jgi:ubiquinone/menaquinone biosynthesis C-methylase UbiE
MTASNQSTAAVLDFWNSRAGLGQWAGTRDVRAKQIEMEVLAAQVRDGMRVLEVGCGNGITAIEIARRHAVQITAFDFAAEMIVAAKDLLAGQELKGSVDFQTGDVRQLADFGQRFDLIYTERVLINLPDWEAQRGALAGILDLLAPGGCYAMLENSQDGLDGLNALRKRASLPAIEAPWHNRYFRDMELAGFSHPGMQLERVDDYSSTYYLISRVINAWQAAREGKEPDYDAPLNELAMLLPPIGNVGQGRLWIWRKDPA